MKAKAATTGGKKKRGRKSGVRGRVLELLASGPKTNAELVAAGGFSAASLYLNLKTLKKEGVVDAARDGRKVVITLIGGSAPAAAAAPHPAAKAAALVAAYMPRDLLKALEGLAHRLSPVDRLQDKLLVLDQLGRSLPAAVADVLREIGIDLKRASAAGS